MNRPALIRHLLIKDLRHQRGWLAMLWLLALLLPIGARSISSGPVETNAFMIGAMGVFEFVYVMILIRVILLDPPGRSMRFLATRPVDWSVLLTSKVLFAGAFLLVPIWIESLGTMYALGMQFDLLDQVLFIVERTISAIALLTVAAVPTFFLRKLTSVMMAIAGGAVLIGIGSLVFADYIRRASVTPPPNPTEFSYQLDHCRWLMFNIGLAFTGAVGAISCYGKRPFKDSFAALGSGLFLSVLLWLYWPINLSVIFADQPRQVPELAPALRDKIRFNIERLPGHPANVTGSGWNNVTTENVDLFGGLSGLDAPYFFAQTGGEAEATLRSGRKLSSSYKGYGIYQGAVLGSGWVGDNLRQQLAGFTPMSGWPRRWQDEGFRAFHYLPDRYRDEDLTGVSIKGVVTFTVGRAFILRTLPLKSGAVLNLPRRRYALQQVEADPSRITFRIVKQYMPLTLRGDVPGWQEWENLSWLVINRRKGECLIDNGAESYGNNLETHHLQRPVMLNGVSTMESIKANYAHAKDPIPADWLDGAEIVFFTSESCGRISFPYEIPSVDLVH